MKRNRGLSLVELLITVAILSIVMVIALSFMVTGSRSFTKGNADSTVQKEAELTVNQIEDMIIDINGGVSMIDDAGKTEMTMYHTEDDGSGTGALLYTKEAVTWNKSNNNVYCSKWKVNYDDSTGTYVVDASAADNYADQLLAEHVTSFDVDLSDTLTTKALDGTTRTIVKSVLVKVGYDDGTGIVNYATSPVITLRNRMLLSDDPANIFDEVTPAAETLKLYYSGAETMGTTVPIVDRVSEVSRGGVYNIYAKINTGADVNDLVDWEIAETGTVSTIDSYGYLTVGTYEANAYLTITARYKSDSSKKATGVVKVVGTTPLKSLKSVHILTKSLKAYEAHYGSTVVTEGFRPDEEAAIIYTWTVMLESGGREMSTVAEDYTDNTKTLDLAIKKDPLNFGQILVITLTAHSDITGETVSDQVKYRINDEGAVGGDSFMERGKGAHSDTDYSFENEWASDHWYEYYFCDIYGGRISEYDYLLGNITVEDRGCKDYGLFISNDLPVNRSYYIKVICYCRNTDWQGFVTNWQREFIQYIPEVRMYGKSNYESTDVNSIFNFYYALDGYYEVAWQNLSDPVYEYSVEEFDYEAPAGVVVTPQFTGGTVTLGDDCTMHAWGSFTCEGATEEQKKEIEFKSMKIKVTMKNHPEIYTYSTVIFE